MKRGLILFPALALVAAAGVPHKVVRKTAALDFSYEWSSQAVQIPALDQRFYKDAKAKLAEAQKNAAEDQVLARQQKRDFNAHYYSMQWTTAGETPRLLSMQSESGSFEGGAHPNTSYGALLWDRLAFREISLASLFTLQGDFGALTLATYCEKLDAERTKKREGEKLELAEFNDCPKYSDLAIAPVDRNKDGLFDAIDFVASPYVAGPYVEGEYEVLVPITARLVAAMKPEYRSSFKAQRQ